MHNICFVLEWFHLRVDPNLREDGDECFDCSCGVEHKASISSALFEFMRSESQQLQVFERMPIWVLWSIQEARVSSSPWLCVFVCVCVFESTKWCFSLMLCSHRSHLVPPWSHKCKHAWFQVFNGFMSHWAKEWEGFLGDKTQIGCYCSVLSVLVFSQCFHMPQLLFGRWKPFKCSKSLHEIFQPNTHTYPSGDFP